MSVNEEAQYRYESPVGQLSLWFGMLGGAGAWFMHLLIAYSLVPLACSADLGILLYATIPLALLVASLATLVGWRGWQRAGEAELDPDDPDDPIRERVRFMGLAGLVASGFFLVVIVAQSVPILMNHPCDPAGSIRI